MADGIPQLEELSPTCVMRLAELLFVDMADRGLKESSIKHYRKRLKPFITKFGPREFASLEPLEVKAYMGGVNRYPAEHKKAGQLMANATRASNATSLELLEAFAIEVRAIPGKILPRLEKPKAKRRETVPTKDEVGQMQRAAAPAAALLMKALNQCAARPSELIGARIHNWHRDEKKIILQDHKTSESTGESRRIPVGKVFARTLATAAGDRGPDEFLFLNTQGKPWSLDTFEKYVSRLRRRLGIREGVVPYGLRHRALTDLSEKAKIEDVARIANHKKLDTTMIYIHKDDDPLADYQDLVNEEDDDGDEELPKAA